MIIIRVELHSAVTRKVTEIARMRISNIGGTRERGDYRAETFRGRSAEQFARLIRQRAATISDHQRLSAAERPRLASRRPRADRHGLRGAEHGDGDVGPF